MCRIAWPLACGAAVCSASAQTTLPTSFAPYTDNYDTSPAPAGGQGDLTLSLSVFPPIWSASYDGIISGSGSVTLEAPGALWVLGAKNTYTGGTVLKPGTLMLSHADALGASGEISLGGGWLRYSAANYNDYSGRFSTAPDQLYRIDTGGEHVTFATALTSAGGKLTKAGSGTLTLTAANTYTGGTTVSGGTLALAGAGTLGAPNAPLLVNGGTLDLGGKRVATGFITLQGGTVQNGTVTASLMAEAGTLGANFAGGSLTKTTSGTATLTGDNNLGSFITRLDAGTLVLGSAGALGSDGSIVLGGGWLRYTAANQTDYSGRFSNAVSQNYNIDTNGQEVTFASALTSPGGTLRKTGEGTLTLTAANTYSGYTIVSGGTLALAGAGMIAPVYLEVQGNGTFDLGGKAVTVGNGVVLRGGTVQNGTLASSSFSVEAGTVAHLTAGSLVKSTPGTATFTGENSFTGVQLDEGTLVLGSAGALGASGSIGFNGGGLRYTAANQTDYSGRFNHAYGRSYNIDTNGQNVTFASKLTSVDGTLTKTGEGTLTLTAANIYSGGTTVSGGTLALAGAGTLGASASLQVNGGTLDLGGKTVATGYIALQGGTVQNGALSSPTFYTTAGTLAADLAGGRLAKDGPGTVTLTGDNRYTGGTTLDEGTLVLGSAGALGSSGEISFHGGRLRYTAANQTDYSARFVRTPDQHYSIDTGGQAVTFATALTSVGGTLTKTGEGTLTLSGANTYTGGTTIDGGTLRLDGSSVGSAFTVNAGGTLGGSGLLAGGATIARGAISRPAARPAR